MATINTGSASIIKYLLKILALYTRLHARDLAERTSPELVAALEALLEIVQPLIEADNFPFQIDAVLPNGPEDAVPE